MKGGKNVAAAAVGEQELYILTSFYLAEYDVDYTANHDQSIEDVPGVPDIALIMAACIASRRIGGGRRGGGCRKVEEVERLQCGLMEEDDRRLAKSQEGR